MTRKRLSEGGDIVVLDDAARAEHVLLARRKQLPVIAIFAAIVALTALYELLVGLGLLLP